MRVTVLAQTSLASSWEKATRDVGFKPDPDATDAETLLEFSGRLCYRSWIKPNAATRANVDYLRNILTQEHYSVIEHATVTLLIQGVSRTLTHELVRHRHFSYSQVSQRFVDSSTAQMVLPPATLTSDSTSYLQGIIYDLVEHATEVYGNVAHILQREGLSRKQAREAARAVLPGGTSTDLVVTGNLRAWREMLERRLAPGADQEIQQLAREILAVLKPIAPVIFEVFDDRQ